MFPRGFLRILAVFVLLCLFVLSAAGCTTQAQPPKPEEQEDESKADPRANWPKGVTVGSASVGGVYFVWAGGWANIITEKLGVPTSVEVTGGPVHNMQLVQAKELEFGYVTNAPAWEGWHGEGWAQGKKHTDVRAIFPMYSSKVHWYALESSGIKTAADINGKSVGVGPVGGTPGTYLPLFIETMGYKPSMVVHGGMSDLTSQMKDNLLDACGWIGGVPLPAALELEASHKVIIFGFTDDEISKITRNFPYFSPSTVKAGVYKSLTNDIKCLAVWNFAITHKDMDENFVYEVVKATFENVETLKQSHPTAEEVLIENVPYSVIPYHKGAVRYFEEKGIKIPANLLPPEGR